MRFFRVYGDGGEDGLHARMVVFEGRPKGTDEREPPSSGYRVDCMEPRRRRGWRALRGRDSVPGDPKTIGDFRRLRLKTFVMPRLSSGLLVTLVTFFLWLDRHDAESWAILMTALATSLTGLLYWGLHTARYDRITALIFAPIDFILCTIAIVVTGGAPGGFLIFQLWCVITAGMIIRPFMAVVLGILSIVVTMACIWLPTGAYSVKPTFELFHGVGVAIVAAVTYVMTKQLDATVERQLELQRQLEEEFNALDEVVQERTEEVVKAYNALENRTIMLAFQRHRAEEANRLKSQFLWNVSHELRTPLNAIYGFADLMGQGIYGPITQRQADRLATIMNRAEDLLNLINDVLDLARAESGRLSLEVNEFDPADVVRGVTLTLEPLLRSRGEDFTLDYTPPAAPFKVSCDRSRYRQILLNLVSNAIQFTERGHVRIQVRLGSDEEFQTVVEDTGVGIRPEDLDVIFEPFRCGGGPAGPGGAGTGLGLYICRQLASAMGGRIEVHSRPGEGSRFLLVLPLRMSAGLEERGTTPEPARSEKRGSLEARIKALEEEMGHSLMQVKAQIEYSPVPTVIYDSDGIIFLWNRACELLSHRAGSSAVRNTIYEALYADATERARKLVSLVFKRYVIQANWEGADADGRPLKRVGIHYPVIEKSGKVELAVGLFIDPALCRPKEGIELLGQARLYRWQKDTLHVGAPSETGSGDAPEQPLEHAPSVSGVSTQKTERDVQDDPHH